MSTSLASYVERQEDAAEQAGAFVLLDLRKGCNAPRHVGEMARFAFHFAVLALYWSNCNQATAAEAA